MSYFVSPAEGRVSSNYGWRTHPITGKRNFHRGIDIANKAGTPVYAAYGGTVRFTYEGNYDSRTKKWGGNPVTGTWNTGKIIIIDGPGGGSELYGHLDKILVKPGQKVEAGQQIGTMGATGNVTGPHLHFETWNGRSQGGGTGAGNTRDPRVDFKRYGVKPGAKPKVTKAAPEKTAAKKSSGKHVVAKDTIRARLRAMGYKKPALLSTWVRNYQKGQRYKPGLAADGVWGPATEAHYKWVRRLQSAMKAWKGNRDTAVDGDFGKFTAARVREIQQRNLGGAYKGKVDGIPGPVFCKMLGIPPHPGAR